MEDGTGFEVLVRIWHVIAQNTDGALPCTAGGHWFFLPGMHCWQMGRWALPKQDMAQLSLCIRQVARLLRSLHDTFAEVETLTLHYALFCETCGITLMHRQSTQYLQCAGKCACHICMHCNFGEQQQSCSFLQTLLICIAWCLQTQEISVQGNIEPCHRGFCVLDGIETQNILSSAVQTAV